MKEWFEQNMSTIEFIFRVIEILIVPVIVAGVGFIKSVSKDIAEIKTFMATSKQKEEFQDEAIKENKESIEKILSDYRFKVITGRKRAHED